MCECVREQMDACLWSQETLFSLCCFCYRYQLYCMGYGYVLCMCACELSDTLSREKSRKRFLLACYSTTMWMRFFRFATSWRLCNALINVYLNRSIRAINNWVVYWLCRVCMNTALRCSRIHSTLHTWSSYLPHCTYIVHILCLV